MRGTFSTPPATPPQEGRRCLLRPQEPGEETIASFLRREGRIDISKARRIGTGSFGKVMSARQYESAESGSYKKIAIKVIKKEKVPAQYLEKVLPREIDCWRQLEHPHLVRMLGHYEMPKKVGADPSTTYCGSRCYTAPEVLSCTPYSPFKADVWSIGVIGFIIVTDTMPFRENIDNLKIVENQKNRSYSYSAQWSISPACSQSIDEMMTFDQQLRPTAADCLRLPLFVVGDVRIR